MLATVSCYLFEMSTKKQIEKLVVKRRKSNLKNHFLCNHGNGYSGDIRDNEIILWRYSLSVGNFFPVLRVKFDEQKKFRSVTGENNQFTKLSWLAATILFLIAIMPDIISPKNITRGTILLTVTYFGVICFMAAILHLIKKEFIKEFESKVENLNVQTTANTR
jgi:uncharacterized membrane protein